MEVFIRRIHRRSLWVLLLLVGASDAAADARPAQLHLVAFRASDAGAVDDLTVQINEQVEGETNRDGVLRLSVTPGTQALCYQRRGMAVRACIDLQFSAGQTTLLMLTLDETGESVSAVTEVPKSSATPLAVESDMGPVSQHDVEIRVLSEETGAGIGQARVFVVGHDLELETDSQGRVVASLPEGAHTISVIHTRYSTAIRRNVAIPSKDGSSLVIKLGPLSLALDDFVITVPRISGSVAKVLEDRRNASSVQDGLGAEELARSPDGSASSASRRIVGATVIGGQFLMVRGLGGRYTSVRLNDVPLPSTDPDMPGVQIDLFPSSLLSSLTIEKTFRADLPANFAGGSMNIQTKAFPEEFTLTTSISTGWNSVSTLRQGLTYPGSSTDWLGTDDGRRALPDRVPSQRVTGVGLRSLPFDEIAEIGQSFETNWETAPNTVSPPISVGVSLGDTLKRKGWIYGYLVTAGYKHEESFAQETRQTFSLRQVDGRSEITARERLIQDVGKRSALIGGLGTFNVKTPRQDTYKLVTVITQTMDDETSRLEGLSEQEDAPVRLTQLQFVERRLWLNQLIGHHPSVVENLDVDWRLNFSSAFRNQPDTRSLLYIQRDEGTPYSYRDSTGSGERLFSDLDQTDYGVAADITYAPLSLADHNLVLKSGLTLSSGRRVFSARRFGVRYIGTVEERSLEPNALFAREGFGERFQFRELTRPDDGYVADLFLFGGYLSVDLSIWQELRAIAGLRIEDSLQSIEAQSPYANPGQELASGEKNYFDPLPSVALIWSIDDRQSLRVVYGGTVARPLVREFAPFLSQDFVRGRGVQGNPDLQRTYIHNYDLRWESFLSTTEVLAASAFYKTFLHPIERVIIDTNGNIRYANVEGATNYGLEFELRLSLERLNASLAAFEFGSNLALIVSNVRLSGEQKSVATSASRPLAGQSPYVANCSLAFKPADTPLSLNLYYNVFGPRIREVGLGGLPDTLEEPFHALDFSASWGFQEHWSLSATVKNILVQPVLITQGGQLAQRVMRGSSMSLKLGYRY